MSTVPPGDRHAKQKSHEWEAFKRFVPNTVWERFCQFPNPLTQPIIEVYDAAVAIIDGCGYSRLAHEVEETAKKLRIGRRGSLEKLRNLTQVIILDNNLTRHGSFSRLANAGSTTETMLSEGPETLARHLNRFLDIVINITEEHGVEVVKFVGDAVICQVRGVNDGDRSDASGLVPRLARCSFLLVEAVMAAHSSLDVHVGIGASRVMGAHVGALGRWEYFTAGNAIKQMGAALDEAGESEVVLSPEAAAMLSQAPPDHPKSNWKGVVLPSGSFKMLGPGPPTLPRVRPFQTRPLPSSIAELNESLSAYTMRYVSSVNRNQDSGEMRKLSIVFLKVLDAPDPGTYLTDTNFRPGEFLRNMNEMMMLIQNQTMRHEAQLRQFVMDDKGTVAIMIVGLPPMSHPDNEVRAMKIALALKTSSRSTAAGVTSGTSYCGFVGNGKRAEYAMVGDAVVLAARLMGKAKAREVICDQATKLAAEKQFHFSALPPMRIKGKAVAVEGFSLEREVVGERGGEGGRQLRLVGCAEQLRSVEDALDRYNMWYSVFGTRPVAGEHRRSRSDSNEVKDGGNPLPAQPFSPAPPASPVTTFTRGRSRSSSSSSSVAATVTTATTGEGSPMSVSVSGPGFLSASSSSSSACVGSPLVRRCCCCVLVTGAPGSGKTLLLLRVRERQFSSSNHVLMCSGRSREGGGGGGAPMEPWAGFFHSVHTMLRGTEGRGGGGGCDTLSDIDDEQSSGASPSASPSTSWVQRRLVPLLLGLGCAPGAVPALNDAFPGCVEETAGSLQLGAGERLSALGHLVEQLVEHLLESASVTVLLDEAHSFRGADWSIVRRMCAGVRLRGRVLVYVAMTEFDGVPPLLELPVEPLCVRIPPLAKRELYPLLAGHYELPAVDAPLVDMLWARAKGNPSLTLGLMEKLVLDGAVMLLPEEGRVSVAQEALAQRAADESMDDMFAKDALMKFDRLAPQHRLCLKVCALVGRVFSLREVCVLFRHRAAKVLKQDEGEVTQEYVRGLLRHLVSVQLISEDVTGMELRSAMSSGFTPPKPKETAPPTPLEVSVAKPAESFPHSPNTNRQSRVVELSGSAPASVQLNPSSSNNSLNRSNSNGSAKYGNGNSNGSGNSNSNGRPSLTTMVSADCLSAGLSSGPPGSSFAFSFPYIRNVIYSTTPQSERTELHLRLADWYRDSYADLSPHHAVIGHHFKMAREHALALSHLLAAAEVALLATSRRSRTEGREGEVEFVLQMCEEALASGGDVLTLTERSFFHGRVVMLQGQLAAQGQMWSEAILLLDQALQVFRHLGGKRKKRPTLSPIQASRGAPDAAAATVTGTDGTRLSGSNSISGGSLRTPRSLAPVQPPSGLKERWGWWGVLFSCLPSTKLRSRVYERGASERSVAVTTASTPAVDHSSDGNQEEEEEEEEKKDLLGLDEMPPLSSGALRDQLLLAPNRRMSWVAAAEKDERYRQLAHQYAAMCSTQLNSVRSLAEIIEARTADVETLMRRSISEMPRLWSQLQPPVVEKSGEGSTTPKQKEDIKEGETESASMHEKPWHQVGGRTSPASPPSALPKEAVAVAPFPLSQLMHGTMRQSPSISRKLLAADSLTESEAYNGNRIVLPMTFRMGGGDALLPHDGGRLGSAASQPRQPGGGESGSTFGGGATGGGGGGSDRIPYTLGRGRTYIQDLARPDDSRLQQLRNSDPTVSGPRLAHVENRSGAGSSGYAQPDNPRGFRNESGTPTIPLIKVLRPRSAALAGKLSLTGERSPSALASSSATAEKRRRKSSGYASGVGGVKRGSGHSIDMQPAFKHASSLPVDDDDVISSVKRDIVTDPIGLLHRSDTVA